MMKTFIVTVILSLALLSQSIASFSAPVLQKIGSQQCLEFHNTVDIKRGWNLITVPFPLSDSSMAKFIEPVKASIAIIWGWDRENGWTKYTPGAKDNSLLTIEPGKAYWIYSYSDSTLSINKRFCWEAP